MSAYDGRGGGIAIIGIEDQIDATSAIFEDCVISKNDASIGGGIYWEDAIAEFDGTRISDNTAYHGAGIYAVGGDVSIVNCDFMRNMAGIFANIDVPDLIEDSEDGISNDPGTTDPGTTDPGTDPEEEEPEGLQDLGGIAGQIPWNLRPCLYPHL